MGNVTSVKAPTDKRKSSGFANHVLVGAVLALVMWGIDLGQSAIRETGPRVDEGDFFIASLHLLALHLFVGVGIGTAVGAIWSMASLVIPRNSIGRVASMGFWFGADASGFARVVTNALVGGLLFVGVALGHFQFTRSFHRADLAGLLLGALVVASMPVLSVLRSLIGRRAKALAFALSIFANRATLVVLAIALLVVAVAILLELNPSILVAYDVVRLAWVPLMGIVWVLSSFGVLLAVRRYPISTLANAALIVALTIGALLTSATTYGSSNRVRSVVEQRSAIGQRLIRSLAAASDWDGDHHSWAFGGHDCNDADSTIHPGAIDPVGDGIDQDCFAGDGAPTVVERGRGDFGAPVAGLERPNFLIVTIDALHRDHLGAYGYERPVSPHIDAFARTAVDFMGVVPQSSRSLRSIPSMWTGNYASEVAFGPEYLWPSLLEENVLAPELLQRRGWNTSVIMGTSYFERMKDFFQGFERVRQIDQYKPPRGQPVGEALVELRRLQSLNAPWLLWVHLFNCHAPYLQDGVPSRFGSELVDKYDTEIALADAEFHRLLQGLDLAGMRENTVIILASDHGEAFGEHGTFGHSTTLYEEELRSLLMMQIPGVTPRRVEGVVGLLDVAPTVLNLAQVPLPHDISGVSLLPFATGQREPTPERPVFSELLPDGLSPFDIKVLRLGERKLMWWVRDGSYQYFDLAEDPEEQNDLSDSERELALEMLGQLRAFVAGISRAENRSDTFVEQNRLSEIPTNMSDPLGIRFPGQFEILGFDLPEREFQIGDTIPLTFYYKVDGPIEQDYFFHVNIEGPPNFPVPPHFHAWHFPLHSMYRTTEWVPGEILRDPTPIVIPHELQVPVTLRVVLRVVDGDRVVIGETSAGPIGAIPIAEIHIRPRTYRAP